ncbi:conserved unknown protein [Ectocarpus siliculosus]|uniref:Uncharacterized protein n=1 Tax=Ectocarpus siliculosus TaxID=2880 RepID=D8LJA9_ECTSI|nr:conserved unknown protein [Ectocarpus siliculosus]|eukprot:CBN76993.1 conserved unknown protein [Ectocarpus siliculosus]
MGLVLVAGCSLIAFGPSIMLWVVVVGKRPALVIIGLVGAFFWLASMAAASVLWTIVPAAQDAWLLSMITGVVLHGFGRLALAKVYVKTEAVINEAAAHAAPASNAHGSSGRYGGALGAEGSGGVGEGRGERKTGDVPDQPEESSGLLRLNGVSSSIAAGVGWGLIHAVIMVGTALSKHMGPGAAFSPSCPHVPSVIVSALSAQAFVVLDLLLMAAAFAAARSGDAGLMSFSFGLHFAAALTTGFNFIEGGCTASLPLLYGVVALAAIALTRYRPLKSAMIRLRR